MPSLLLQSLVLAAAAITASDAAPAAPAFCPKSNCVANALKAPAATSFCKWYLPVSTQTSTRYTTVDASSTATATSTQYKGTIIITLPATTKTKTAPAATITSVPTTTSVSTLVVTTCVDVPTATMKARSVQPKNAIPAALRKLSPASLKAACSCLRIPAKIATVTSMVTAQRKTVTSVTTIPYTMSVQPTITTVVTPTSSVTGTSTSTIVSVTTSTVTQSPPQATNVVPNGDFQTGQIAPWQRALGPVGLGQRQDGADFFAVFQPNDRMGPPTILTQPGIPLTAGETYDVSFTSSLSFVQTGSVGSCSMSVDVNGITVAQYTVSATDEPNVPSVKRAQIVAPSENGQMSFLYSCNSLNRAGSLNLDIDDVSIVSISPQSCPVEEEESTARR